VVAFVTFTKNVASLAKLAPDSTQNRSWTLFCICIVTV